MVELHWDGKYKENKKTAPVRVALPFQTVETINEGTAIRVQQLDLLMQGKPTEWRNRLIWGDKKYVLPSLLPEFAGKVNLIYIDPPFNTGADFSFTATIPSYNEDEEEETFIKEPSILEQKAYRDTWGKGLDSYLLWFYETAVLLRELLADNGSIYVHLDWHVGHYAKIVLDEVFGNNFFQGEIIFKRTGGHHLASGLDVMTDTLYYYTKSENRFYKQQFQTLSSDEMLAKFPYVEQETGRRFTHEKLEQTSNSYSKGEERIIQGRKVVSNIGWRWTQETFDDRLKENEYCIFWTENKRPRYKRYADEYLGRKIGNLWDDVKLIYSNSKEDLHYPTQKPEHLLERVIKSSSSEGDLVLDCFCGSGTTAAVAEKLNRRYIACDLGRFAIHTTRKRLLSIPNVKPFVVQNLGKYERQEWQKAEFATMVDVVSIEQAYRKFILELYHSEPLTGFIQLHGIKGKHIVHIGSVDAPVTITDVKEIIKEFWKSVGTTKDIKENTIDILGWEFALDMNETVRQLAEENKVNLHFKKIPREVLERRAVEQGDIKFFELCALGLDYELDKKKITVKLKDFTIHPDDVPEEVRRNVKHWSQWIDYWAVDWDYKNDTFHNQSTTFRTRKEPTLLLSLEHTYEKKGDYTVLVKVIDILGNDTTKAIQVRVR